MFANFCRRARRLMYIFYEDFINKKEIQFCIHANSKQDSIVHTTLFYIFVKSYIPKVIIKQNLIICVYSYALYLKFDYTDGTIIYSCYTK